MRWLNLFVTPALALIGAAALGGCVAYPGSYGAGYGGGYYGPQYAYGTPAYEPAPLFGLDFFGGGDHDHGGRDLHGRDRDHGGHDRGHDEHDDRR